MVQYTYSDINTKDFELLTCTSSIIPGYFYLKLILLNKHNHFSFTERLYILKMLKYFFPVVFLISCNSKILITRKPNTSTTGSAFYKEAAGLQWKQRDSLAMHYILSGHIPAFLNKMQPVNFIFHNNGKRYRVTYFVSSDYLSVGTDDDGARIPLTPMFSQKIADSLDCFLPTTKMVNDIHEHATIKLAPIPLVENRDNSNTMYQHHLLIQEQYKNQKGIISGIKKDIVITDQLNNKPDRVAIYGWYKLNGKPIQPLYTGHVNWYADYSHGTRLIYKKIRINGKWFEHSTVFKDPVLRKILTNEATSDFLKYKY